MAADSLEPLPSSQESPVDRLPPISILDLLLFTGATATVLAYQEQWSSYQNMPEIPLALVYGARLVYALTSGIALTSLYWLTRQKRLTGRFFIHPGHWMLASFATLHVGSFLAMLAFRPAGDFVVSSGYGMENLYMYLFLSFAIVEVIGCVWLLAGAKVNTGIWRAVLILMTIGLISTAISSVANSLILGAVSETLISFWPIIEQLALVFHLICLVVLLIAVIRDRRKRIVRDWLHFAALIVCFVQFAVGPILNLVFSYFLTFRAATGTAV